MNQLVRVMMNEVYSTVAIDEESEDLFDDERSVFVLEIAGALSGLMCIIIICWCIRRRKSSRIEVTFEDNPEPVHVSNEDNYVINYPKIRTYETNDEHDNVNKNSKNVNKKDNVLPMKVTPNVLSMKVTPNEVHEVDANAKNVQKEDDVLPMKVTPNELHEVRNKSVEKDEYKIVRGETGGFSPEFTNRNDSMYEQPEQFHLGSNVKRENTNGQ